jgi:hypothetical protein
MAAMYVLEARQLRKSFGEGEAAVEALRGVDLGVEAGEIDDRAHHQSYRQSRKHVNENAPHNQFDVHLSCLDRREDREMLESVIDEEKFHLSYVEGELERQVNGDNAAFVATALEQARARFAIFQQNRRAESMEALQRLLGGGA